MRSPVPRSRGDKVAETPQAMGSWRVGPAGNDALSATVCPQAGPPCLPSMLCCQSERRGDRKGAGGSPKQSGRAAPPAGSPPPQARLRIS